MNFDLFKMLPTNYSFKNHVYIYVCVCVCVLTGIGIK